MNWIKSFFVNSKLIDITNALIKDRDKLMKLSYKRHQKIKSQKNEILRLTGNLKKQSDQITALTGKNKKLTDKYCK